MVAETRKALRVGASSMAAPPSSFVGRRDELASIARTLEGGARVVTLLGTAGTGKTRLAMEYSARAREPVWFCDLTEARVLEDVGVALGRALDVPLAGEALIEQLGHALAARGEVLVLLDNLEQVVEHAAAAIGAWLAAAPGARFLTTSRERLQIAGEICIPVGPLGVPGDDAVDPRAILECASVELLLDRASAVRPMGEVGAEQAALLAAIVRRVEGLPLAIELCAARMGVLGPAQLLAMLSRQLDLLARGDRTASPRQATLRGAIVWSWDLLQPPERRALAECSVFRGGFALEAASAVLGDGALDRLQALHDKSLLRVEDAPGLPGERRYALYESVRELAAEQLAGLGLADETAARHAAWFLRAGASWAEGVDGPGGALLRQRLALETENLLLVHDRSPRSPDAVRALLALEPIFLTRGPTDRYARLLARAIDALEDADAALIARASIARAWALFLLGHHADAAGDLDRAVAAARRAPAEGLLAKAITMLALICVVKGDFAGAGARFAEAEAALGADALPVARGLFARSYGIFLARQGRIAEACVRFEEALEIARRAGDSYGEGLALHYLASRAFELGKLDRARGYVSEALSAFGRFDDLRLRGTCLGMIGAIEQEQGSFDEAGAHLDEALAIHRAVGDRHSAAGSLGRVATLALERGDARAARARYEEAIPILRDVTDLRFHGLFLAGLASAEAMLSEVAEARTHLAEAERLLTTAGTPADREALAIAAGHLDLALARQAGDAQAAMEHERAARDRLRAVAGPAPDEVRCVARILAAALERHAGPRSAALVVGPEARWFEAPGVARVEMLRRGPVRRILLELASAHRSAPGRGLPVSRIVEIGWPGERIHPTAAANRAKVAVATLRKLGLGRILQTRDDGYVLDPALSVVLDAG